MKYKKYEKFIEVTFELPEIKNQEKFVSDLLEKYPEAVNIKLIPCEIILEPRRLSVSKHDNSVKIYHFKHKSQIKDCSRDPKYEENNECDDCK